MFGNCQHYQNDENDLKKHRRKLLSDRLKSLFHQGSYTFTTMSLKIIQVSVKSPRSLRPAC